MSSFYIKFSDYLNCGKNFYKLFFFLVVFLCTVKFPSLLTTDIQPWDEGMYATRVLSIHENGDFVDQSSHSVGKFYSASHPPLLIWIGYFVTSVTGTNAVSFKLISFTFSVFCLLLIFLTGKKLSDQKTGFLAAIIFSGNMIFNVFSKRFQFDFPYTFFILLSFYLLFLYNDSLKFKYLIFGGISFGCCLMTKILVGSFIPLILFISYFFIRDKVNYKLRDVFLLTAIGIGIAIPWHLYMIINYGKEFTDFFFEFHIYERALRGVEMNEKNSGAFFYINFLLSILPFSILVFFGFIKDLKNYRGLDWKKIFLWVWFFTGLVIITLFRTKLEVYIILILPPLSLLIPLFINEIDKENIIFKSVTILFTILNILWFAVKFLKIDIKTYLLTSNKLLIVLFILVFISLLFILCKYTVNKIELNKLYYIFILFFFFMFNVYYAFRINEGETDFNISGIKDYTDNHHREKIFYIGSDYRFNPQFSFYFNGLNLNWEEPGYEFEMLDTKYGIEKTKVMLSGVNENKIYIIVERDKINRAIYPDSKLFIPEKFKLVMKKEGYELYEN